MLDAPRDGAGAGGLVVAWLFSLTPTGRSLLTFEWEIVGISGSLGACLTGYELWRRRNRTVLVRAGDRIAVFRKGRLDLTLAPGEIRLVKADLILMIKLVMGLGAFASIFTAVGTISIIEAERITADNLIPLLAGLTGWVSLAFAARTGFACVHLWVRIKGGRLMAMETVLVRSFRSKELFSP